VWTIPARKRVTIAAIGISANRYAQCARFAAYSGSALGVNEFFFISKHVFYSLNA
jgi:hypothetical protein